MQKSPDRSNSRRSSRRTGTRIYHRLLMLLFAAIIIGVALIVYTALKEGIGNPVSSTGKYESVQSTVTTEPSEPDTEPSELETQPSEPDTEPSEPDTEPSETTPEDTEPSESATEDTEPSEPDTEPTTELEELLTPQELAQLYLENMSLEEKVWQMMFVTTAQTESSYGEKYPVGGLYFQAEDMTEVQKLGDDLFALQATSKTPLLIGLTHEGGSVAPLSSLGLVDPTESMRTYGDAGDADALYQVGLTMGQQIAGAGFHFNLAPIADTYIPGLNEAEMQERTFGTDAAAESGVLSNMVARMVQGLHDGGTIACLKYFPNFGTADKQTYYWRDIEKFRNIDGLAFAAGIDAGAPMVLVSNTCAPSLTNGQYIPCCRAKEVVTDLLRTELGFNGLILTDDQRKETNVGNYVSMIAAGCDVIYLPSDAKAAVDAIMAAVENGTLTEDRINESVYRILLLKCESGIITE